MNLQLPRAVAGQPISASFLNQLVDAIEAFARLTVTPPLNLRENEYGGFQFEMDLTQLGGDLTIENGDGSTSFAGISKVQFAASTVTSPEEGVAKVTVGGVTLGELDGTPSYSGVITIVANQADGLTVSQTSAQATAKMAQLNLADASVTQAGKLNTGNQELAGNKTLEGSIALRAPTGFPSVSDTPPLYRLHLTGKGKPGWKDSFEGIAGLVCTMGGNANHTNSSTPPKLGDYTTYIGMDTYAVGGGVHYQRIILGGKYQETTGNPVENTSMSVEVRGFLNVNDGITADSGSRLRGLTVYGPANYGGAGNFSPSIHVPNPDGVPRNSTTDLRGLIHSERGYSVTGSTGLKLGVSDFGNYVQAEGGIVTSVETRYTPPNMISPPYNPTSGVTYHLVSINGVVQWAPV